MGMNNKGLSLVEVLVVMAISTIVMLLATTLIVNSSRMYSRESNTIDVQNEAQIIVNNLNEAFMEANKLEVTTDVYSALVSLNTMEDVTGRGYLSDTKSYCRNLYFNGNNKFLGMLVAASKDSTASGNPYVAKSLTELDGDSSEQLMGYQLSNLVTDFRVTYDPVCYKGEKTESGVTTYYLTNPVKVKCKFTIQTATYFYDYEVSVQLRNSISEAKLPVSLDDQTDIRTFKVVDR